MKKLLANLVLTFTLIVSSSVSVYASDGFIFQNDSSINTAISMYVGDNYLSGSIYVPSGVTTPFNISRLRNIYREKFNVSGNDFTAIILIFSENELVNVTYQSKNTLFNGLSTFVYDEDVDYNFEFIAFAE